MRSCGGGVIHVAKERTIVDEEGKEHRLLNENDLIEIGGAMALWGDNFILLVEEGTKLPSNLQGLYEVRYRAGPFDAEATMRLRESFKKFKSR
jgi:predicted nucleotide-binding protein